MNTTAAAIQANVTVATIRTWCKNGVVTATKTAGRWIIDTASLAHRIAIGALKTRQPAAKPVALTVENMVAIGGNRWQRGDRDRVYLNDWAAFTGLEVTHYGSGNISSASLDGRSIANSRAGAILGSIYKVYFDAADGQLYYQHTGANAISVRYLDGERDTINLLARITAGIRTAIAAL